MGLYKEDLKGGGNLGLTSRHDERLQFNWRLCIWVNLFKPEVLLGEVINLLKGITLGVVRFEKINNKWVKIE